MDSIIDQALNDRSGKENFVTAQANYSQLQMVYGLGQCTPDLSGPMCQSCLSNCIRQFPICCDAKVGGRVLLGSCNVRYEMYVFYNVSAAPLPPSPVAPPPPPPSTTTTSGAAPLPPSPVIPPPPPPPSTTTRSSPGKTSFFFVKLGFGI